MGNPATTEPDQGESLKPSLLLECRAMAAYAFGAGLKVPPAVAEALDALESPPAGEERSAPKAEPRGVSPRMAPTTDAKSRGDSTIRIASAEASAITGSWKFSVCGPTTIGFPKAATSIGSDPPIGTRERPTKDTSARE